MLKKAEKLTKAARLRVTGLRTVDGRFVDANGDGIPDSSWTRTLTPKKKEAMVDIS